MATAQELLNIARGELGATESPANSNRTKYGAWYGLDGQPWCVMFVEWVFAQAGVKLPIETASCTILMNAAKSAGNWVTSNYQTGDVVIYDWGGDKRPDHCGIVEAVGGSSITAIEGNTAIGNDSDGGQVMRRTRTLGQIVGAVRPKYEEYDMDVEALTEAQLIRLAERMQAALGKCPLGETLAPELQEAVAAGITDGSNPNAFCTRAQAAVMVKRVK